MCMWTPRWKTGRVDTQGRWSGLPPMAIQHHQSSCPFHEWGSSPCLSQALLPWQTSCSLPESASMLSTGTTPIHQLCAAIFARTALVGQTNFCTANEGISPSMDAPSKSVKKFAAQSGACVCNKASEQLKDTRTTTMTKPQPISPSCWAHFPCQRCCLDNF